MFPIVVNRQHTVSVCLCVHVRDVDARVSVEQASNHKTGHSCRIIMSVVMNMDELT